MRPISFGHPDRNMVFTMPREGSPPTTSKNSTSFESLLVLNGLISLRCRLRVTDGEEFLWGSNFFLDFEGTFFKDGGFGFTFSGEIVLLDLFLKHLIAVQGWHARATREATNKHFSSMV